MSRLKIYTYIGSSDNAMEYIPLLISEYKHILSVIISSNKVATGFSLNDGSIHHAYYYSYGIYNDDTYHYIFIIKFETYSAGSTTRYDYEGKVSITSDYTIKILYMDD